MKPIYNSQLRWDHFFIEMAQLMATKSKDPSTKVGCVLVGTNNQVLSVGYNGFPRFISGDDDPQGERWERPIKYEYVEHAERNAIYNAARSGIATDQAVAYMNWEPTPCAECTRAFIQAGIIKIVGPAIPFGGHGDGVHYHTDEDSVSMNMIRESGIIRKVIQIH